MAVILGTTTTVIVDGSDTGFQSVSWGINRQTTRLWQLGSWGPYKTQVAMTISVNITSYANTLSYVNLEPSSSCTNSSAHSHIVINAAACGAGAVGVNEDNMFLNSYSYSKGDPIGFATESWGFQKWVQSDVVGEEFINTIAPTYVLQGITEGSRSGDVTNIGVVYDSEGIVSGEKGSVSAGVPGKGASDTTELGIVTRVGGGSLEEGGKIGQSSASIPLVPIYVG